MVTGFRRAFCTSTPKEREPSSTIQTQQQQQCSSNNIPPHSPRISSKFGFFSSNPSTPRLLSHFQQPPPISTPSLRCKTTTTAATTPTSSLPNSPRLQCKTPPPLKKTSHSPRFFHFSKTNTNTNTNCSSPPSSPKSPATSALSLLKSTLRLSKQQSSRCGICIQGVKSGEGTAIFTAECNHVFHFPCVTAQLKKNPSLSCPVCSTKWKQLPLLSIHHCVSHSSDSPTLKFDIKSSNNNKLRVYNDDEPLMSPFSIPELEENDLAEEEEDLQEFQGFFVTTPPSVGSKKALADVTVSLSPESAVVAMGRGFETSVVVVKVKARAPPCVASRGNPRRAPIDLVAVVDVSERMGGVKSQVMKRAMRLLVSSLTSADRLSVVAFSGSSKRLFPLRRMTVDGRRSARRLVDALASGTGTAAPPGQGMMSVNDALKKAAKVIEDRREKNHVATIMILSNGHDERSDRSSSNNQSRLPLVVSSTRFSHLETPVHSIGFGEVNAYNHAPFEDAFAKCLRGLLSVVVQDVNLQLGFVSGSAEISAVYSLADVPGVFGPGSVRIGDLHAEEEREFLVELKVPVSSSGTQHNVMSVRSSCRDALSQELIVGKERGLLLPKSHPVRSSPPSIQRLRNLHVTTRAVAESRRLMERGDLSGAHYLLSAARAMLMKSTVSGSPGECLRGLEAELTELNRRGLVSNGNNRQRRSSSNQQVEKPEPLTPTSAWRAAERLAKVAITRKQMNRVSDLHGFENARF